ncbi:MAG: 50S ribosomal protein L9 [Bacteroidetes bacterium]|nr:50S ribosomal protein L9 [Bacteroidota bacterium]
MEIILKKDVDKLGYADDVVNVKPGYARNFLIPQGVAIIANSSNKKILAETRKQRAFKEEKLRSAATASAEKLAGTTVKVGAKAGESGKIFGSVTTVQLADALKKAGFEVDRKNITIKEDPIKTLGTYVANVKLYKDINADVNFEVIEE